jgi:hypothetical protein
MPLVNNSNGVNVDFTANADDLLADSDRVIKELDRVKKAVKDNGRQLEEQARREQQALKQNSLSWTDFRSAYQTAMDVVRVGQQVYAATVGELITYGDEVKKLAVITGQSSEETSRQIQLADDLRVSYDTLARSLQFATKKGFDTSTEGLIKLGEEYKKLPEGIERTQFLMEKFGKSGIEMNKILGQTSDQIRALAAGTPDGLILSQKDIAAIDEYNKNVDQLNDSFTSLKMNVARDVLPSLVELTDFFNDPNANTAADFINKVFEGTSIESKAHKAARLLKDDLKDTGDQAQVTADDLGELEDPLQAAEDAAKNLSKTLTGMLDSMFAINKEDERYAQTLADLSKSDGDLAAQKNQLTLKMWEEQRAGKLTNDTYLEYVQRLDEITKKQEENASKREQAAQDNKDATNQRVYDLVQERLAADGVIDSGEYEYLQNLAVAKGLVTQKAADQAIQESKAADALVQNFSKTQPMMDTALATMQNIAAYDGRIVQFGVNFQQTGSLAGMGGTANPGGYSYNTNHSNTYHPINYGGTYHDRDSGGSGMAGTPYMIGTGAQPEMFVPSTNGTFVPNANKLGSTYNITVINPKRETAENSIRQELKKLSYIGTTL